MGKVVMAFDAVYEKKNELVNHIVRELGDRTLDVSGDNVRVFAVEHHCNEALWGTLHTMSGYGFSLGSDCDNMELVWRDMIIEDLAMVLDYLRTGNW